MKSQKSFVEDRKASLYLVPTPIGNLEDITLRALKILQNVDVIAAEDTRNTRKLLTHFEIQTPMISYHEHNKKTSGEKIIQLLAEGKTIALVSDAGMPAISDPGYELIQDVIHNGFPVIAIPGANAALTALIASGIQPQPFYFHGFLPRKKQEREKMLADLKGMRATMVFYEAPHRLKETLEAMFQTWGDREIVLARELTKKFEEYLRGTLLEALDWVKRETVRGEFCLIVEGAAAGENEELSFWWQSLSVKEHVQYYVEKGESVKEAIKKTAKERGMNRREVYRIFHIE